MAASNRLTEARIRNAKPQEKNYKLWDGEGMYLEIMASGSKYWRMKYYFAGSENRCSLGVYPAISLAVARERREKARRLLAEGKDPNAVKRDEKNAQKVAKSNTFRAVAEEFVEKRKREGAAPQTLSKIEWILDKKLLPVLGRHSIAALTPQIVLQALSQIENDGLHETANRAKRVAGQVLRYAVATGRAERDVTQDLKGALTTPQVKHRAAITDPAQLAELLLSIDKYEGTPVVRAALLLTPLLFQRPGELRQMEWTEISWEQQVWEIPADKMKMKQPHIVPLPKQARQVLKGIESITGGGKYVFPSARRGGKPLSENGVRTALRSLGYGNDVVSPHGFRATARTLLDEVLGCRVDWIEQQLAHTVRDTNGRAYNRTKYLKERKSMMQDWADYLDELKRGSAKTD